MKRGLNVGDNRAHSMAVFYVYVLKGLQYFFSLQSYDHGILKLLVESCLWAHPSFRDHQMLSHL